VLLAEICPHKIRESGAPSVMVDTTFRSLPFCAPATKSGLARQSRLNGGAPTNFETQRIPSSQITSTKGTQTHKSRPCDTKRAAAWKGNESDSSDTVPRSRRRGCCRSSSRGDYRLENQRSGYQPRSEIARVDHRSAEWRRSPEIAFGS
jgi:hypothetical protein